VATWFPQPNLLNSQRLAVNSEYYPTLGGKTQELIRRCLVFNDLAC